MTISRLFMAPALFHREPQPRGDRRRAVRRAERVVLALLAGGEARKPAALAQSADAVAAAGEDLVRIALMADVPDQPVARRIEDIVKGDRQLDHPQAGTEMAAGHGDRVDQILAQLVGDLRQFLLLKLAQILRIGDLIQQWCAAVVADLAQIQSPCAVGSTTPRGEAPRVNCAMSVFPGRILLTL
jgi:hypothetical protein